MPTAWLRQTACRTREGLPVGLGPHGDEVRPPRGRRGASRQTITKFKGLAWTPQMSACRQSEWLGMSHGPTESHGQMTVSDRLLGFGHRTHTSSDLRKCCRDGGI